MEEKDIEVEEAKVVSEDAPMGEKKMNPLYISVAAGLVVIVALGLLIMKKSNNGDEVSSVVPEEAAEVVNGTPTEIPVVAGASSSATLDEKGARVVNMEAGSFYYKPNVINAKKGEKIKLVMKSMDMMHNFNIEELNVHSPLVKSGETNSVVFVADKAGTFEFYCSIGKHRANGQIGKITVK